MMINTAAISSNDCRILKSVLQDPLGFVVVPVDHTYACNGFEGVFF